MSEDRKIPRLGKAAKEFNVGTSTIVDFLSKRGFEIVDNTNSKLTEEMFDLLVEKYQKDRDVKEKADQIEIGTAAKAASAIEQKTAKGKKEETPKKNKEKEASVKSKKVSEKAIETPIVADITQTEAEQTEEKSESVVEQIEVINKEESVEQEETPKIGLKIVGKVDIESISKTTKKSKATKIAKEKKKEKVDKKQEETSSEKHKNEKEEEIVVAEPQKQIIEEELKSEPEPKSEEKTVEENVVEQKDVQEKEKEEKIVEQPQIEQVEQIIATPPAKEHIETKVPQLKGATTVGKIDLDAINSRTKPKRKSKEERRKEAEERIRAEKKFAAEQQHKMATEYAQKNNLNINVDNFIETRANKLSGVKVVDKIDIDALNNSKGEKSEGNKKKEKRKRITKFSPEDKFPIEDKKSENFFKKKDKHREKRPDITSEDVEKSIKKTMAKMAPLGKTKASKHRREKRELIHKEIELMHEKQAEESSILKLTEFITVNELATMMNVPVNKLIATCLGIGLFVSINQRLEKENIVLLAEEYGFQVQFSDTELEDEIIVEEDSENLEPRAPIVTVMGHVDHGKTSLLDYIRKTNVIAGEAGGITQHIGAYEVHLPDGRKITFLDTPGHEAFTAMRARGAKITDIVIIVIAADDAIMPQTVEAINHAQAAGVPMIFAINKIDKPGADPDKIRTALANMNLLVEEWGGKIQSQDISAKKGINVDILLEKVLIEAELLELKANPKAVAVGTVIESSLDKGRGYVAKMLIQNGTLKKGDIVVAGTSYGKIKAMYNERNQLITAAGPSSPVLLLGLDSAPQAGDTFRVFAEEKEAKSLVSKRQQLLREQGLKTQKHITLTEIGRRIAIGDFKELNIIVKGDVDGSVEALSDSLLRLTTEEVQVNVIHKSVGQVTESDVLLASASNAIIIAFQVRPSGGAKKLSEQEQVDIRTYSVIYDAINDLKDAIEGMKAPELKESIVCNIEVREVFRISKVGTVAGCYVLDGKVQRTTRIRVIRDGIVIYTGRLGSLKRYKDDVKEVTAGYECGLNIESFNDIKVGDIIEGFEEVEVKK